MNWSRKRRVTVLTAAGVLWFIFYLLDYQCPSQYFFGIPCLGCGMTTAAKNILRGEFSQAWQANPGIYFWLAAGAVWVAYPVTGQNPVRK